MRIHMPWERQVKLDATLSFATLGGAMQTKTLRFDYGRGIAPSTEFLMQHLDQRSGVLPASVRPNAQCVAAKVLARM